MASVIARRWKNQNLAVKKRARIAKTSAATIPSMVLPGLTAGNSLRERRDKHAELTPVCEREQPGGDRDEPGDQQQVRDRVPDA